LRACTKLPIAVGFGVSTAEHVATLGEFADAAVVGSALVAIIEKSSRDEAPSSIARFIKGLRESPALEETGALARSFSFSRDEMPRILNHEESKA
jgi:tryptophan synthase alpha chain